MDIISSEKINTFYNYLKDYGNKPDNEIHLLYLITSPKKIYKNSLINKKNDAIVTAIVLIKKGTSYCFEEVQFNWSSIDLLRIFNKIDNEKCMSFIGESSNYKHLFKKMINLRVNMADVSEIKLVDVIKKYGFYTKLTPELINKYENERFLLFHSNNIKFIVSCVEVLRYFYCYSFGDSLKQAIFHPSGLHHIVKTCIKKNENVYELYLQSLCEMNDAQKVFYFVRDSIYQNIFHKVFYKYKEEDIISATFPFFNAFTFSFNCYINKKKNTALITNVLNSNMIKTLSKRTILNVYHPNSSRNTNENEDDFFKEKTNKIFSSSSQNVIDDKLSTINSLPYELIEDNKSAIKDENHIKINYISKKIKYKHMKKEIIYQDTYGLSTSNTFNSKKAKKVMTSNINTSFDDIQASLINDKSFFNTEKLKEVFKNLNFEYIDEFVFEFPDLKLYGGIQKKAISYIDNELKIKRTYLVLYLKKGNQKYYYIDVEPDRHNTKKEILILINLSEEYIHKIVYQQVFYGNHKWLSKNSFGFLEYRDYITLNHSKKVKNFSSSILNKLKRRNRNE